MKLTRAVALGAVALGLLVASGPEALASTASSAAPAPAPTLKFKCLPGPGTVRPPAGKRVIVLCCPAPVNRKAAFHVFCCPRLFQWVGQRYTVVVAACCVAPVSLRQFRAGLPVRALVLGCVHQVLVFDGTSGSGLFTEVHGPRLFAHEVIRYLGRLYVISSVHGRQFTLDYRGRPFTDEGPAIRNGFALILPGPVYWVVPQPVPAK